MPFAPLVMAEFIALTISLTFEVSEPVHWYEQPSSLHASSAPYLVGTKNGFVVTWLTSTNLSLFVWANTPPPPSCAACAVAVGVEALSLDDPHAASIVATIPAAPPVKALRLVNARSFDAGVSSSLASAHSRRSTASWTGSSSDTDSSSSRRAAC